MLPVHEQASITRYSHLFRPVSGSVFATTIIDTLTQTDILVLKFLYVLNMCQFVSDHIIRKQKILISQWMTFLRYSTDPWKWTGGSAVSLRGWNWVATRTPRCSTMSTRCSRKESQIMKLLRTHDRRWSSWLRQKPQWEKKCKEKVRYNCSIKAVMVWHFIYSGEHSRWSASCCNGIHSRSSSTE